MITVSVVLYNNSKEEINILSNTILNSGMVKKLYFIDNSEHQDWSGDFNTENIVYIKNKKNIGFGAAHNITIKKAIENGAKYHIVLNPDITIEEGTIEELCLFMNENPSIGLVMPRVVYPDGKPQYLCKLLPRSSDLFIRRFLSFTKRAKKLEQQYELRHLDYSNIQLNIPVLSGCFMFFRISTLKEIGLFDERFFMYLEDVDLCRRVHATAKTCYYPFKTIIHTYRKGSYHNFKLLSYHIASAIKYFNKWGWFADKGRNGINTPFINL